MCIRDRADGETSIRHGEEAVGQFDPRDALWENENLDYESSRPISDQKLRRVIRDAREKAAYQREQAARRTGLEEENDE